MNTLNSGGTTTDGVNNMGNPIITFAHPRSGSTLSTRLMGKCVDSNGQRVSANGETNFLGQMLQLFKVLSTSERFSNSVKGATGSKFAPHHRAGYRDNKSLAAILENWCGGSGKTWYMKEVNYGNGHYLALEDIIEMLIELFPNVKFIFLTRNTADVRNSMMEKGWWGDTCSVDNMIRTQTQNFERALLTYPDRAFGLKYEDMIRKEYFLPFLENMGLALDPDEYDKILSVNLR